MRLTVTENNVKLNYISLNKLGKYNQRNNIEIQGIPSNVADEALKDKVVNVFKLFNIDIKKSAIEGCHRLGKANSKKKNYLFCE